MFTFTILHIYARIKKLKKNLKGQNLKGHPLESSGQAGSCVFLIFLFKNQVFLLFKLNVNMTTHLVMTSIGVNMHQSPI